MRIPSTHNVIKSLKQAGLRLVIFAIVFTSVFADWTAVPWATFMHPKEAQAATFQMDTGQFVGDGITKSITGLGFAPELVILKSDSNAIGTVFKTTAMPQTATAYVGLATADTNLIQLDSDGFTVIGAGDTANVTYTWTAFTGSDCSASGTFCVGAYTGTGAGTQAITSVGFQPDLVWVKRPTAFAGSWRSSSMPNSVGQYFIATGQDTAGALFTTLDATGFTVGATNNAASNYYFVAFKNVTGSVKVGSYTGNGADNTNITGVGFQPDFMFVKATTTQIGVHVVEESYGDNASQFTNLANTTNTIQALQSDGFQIGTGAQANVNGQTFYYAAFGGNSTPSSSGTFKMATGSYVGTGSFKTFSNLGFTPDLIIIKASSTAAGVFRTSLMAGDSTAYLDSGTANFAGGIVSMSQSGFTVGTSTQTGLNGVTYYYTAYGNAWKQSNKSGASDFAIGAYYGSGTDSRNISRLPFQPNMVTIKRSGATGATFRTSAHTGDVSSFFAATATSTNNVQALNSDGFQVGTAANVNTAANIYWWFAFKSGTNFEVGTYSGTGVAKTVSTAFQPDLVWVKRDTAVQGVARNSSYNAGDGATSFITAGKVVGSINGFSSGGFDVGTASEANASGTNNYKYVAWKSNSTPGSSSFQMDTGQFVGDGITKSITGLGFAPELVILKSDSNAIGTVFKTTAMPQTATAYVGLATADTNLIQLDSDGFTVIGAGDTANVTYTWTAFTGSDCSASGTFCVGAYTGTGAGTQAITSVGFQPDLVWVKRPTAFAGSWRSSSMPNSVGQYFIATGQDTAGALFTTLDATGFTVGATNNAASNYYFVAFKNVTGSVKVGSYTGNGADNTNITGVGFQPDFMFVKATTTQIGVHVVEESYGDNASQFTNLANTTNTIQALQSDGFQIGTGAQANVNGQTFYYAAFGGNSTPSSSGTFKMATGSYVGTGSFKTFSNLGFTPDLIIIKASSTAAGVFRTSLMAGDSTAYLDSGTANFAGGIVSMSQSGFTVGTSTQTGLNGVTYYYTAYGNAWKQSNKSGASDFAIGAYYGSGTDSRNISRLPFQPNMVTIKRSGATGATFRTSAHTGDVSSFFAATATSTNNVQALNSDGFQVGTAANVNTAANIYWWFAFKSGTNFEVGTYSGTGVAKTVSTAFQPDLVWVKRDTAVQGVARNSSYNAGDGATSFITAGKVVGSINGFSSGGFDVGTASEANASGTNNYKYVAWKTNVLSQVHYHWRNDNGSESTATTTVAEDTPYTQAEEGKTLRLRLEVSNQGTTTPSMTYRLEYGEKVSTCSAIGSWTRVGDGGGAWDMSDTPNLDNGTDTTNIATSTGGVTDANTTFKTPNGGVRDTSDETGSISLTSSEFIELEYAIKATASSTDGSTYCFRVTDAGTPLAGYNVYPEATFNVHLEVSATGTLATFIDTPKVDSYVGSTTGMGARFVILDKEAGDTHTITDITITETGTVDAQTNLKNIRLYHDLDTTAPYDCVSESFSGTSTETQFGSTDTDGFSSSNGVSTFVGSVVASSTQTVCLYPVMDFASTTPDASTLRLQVTVPSLDVIAEDGDIARPSDTIQLTGTTTLRSDTLTQSHYHFRNDNNTEALATSLTVGIEDVPASTFGKSVGKRLRLEVSNEGSTSSAPISYRLEYGTKVTTCSAVSSWTDVGATGGAFDMIETLNLFDGNDTTNIATSTGGVTDENTTFKTPNGGVKDTSSQTAPLVLTETQFVELEYSIVASSSAVDDTTYCFRLTNAGVPLVAYSIYPEATIVPDVTVSATGTQKAFLDAPSVNVHVGGAFVITDSTGSRNVTDIIITETGTIDAQNDLKNIKLYYDQDTTAPYDCISETYADGATLFGSVDTDGFSSANGVSSFSDSVGIATSSTLCVYTVVDVGTTTQNGQTLNIQIINPSLEVVTDSGVVVPNIPVDISGTSVIRTPILDQTHYHWRGDNGTEVTATSLTGDVEDTIYSVLGRGVTTRLRLEVSNEGSTSSAPISYRLEYGTKVTTCSAVSSWTDVGATGGAFDMIETLNLFDGNDTTNIATSTGGVTDENTTFKTPNGGVKDTSSQTAPLVLTETQFVELEYSIVASSSAVASTTYCFRTTNAGATTTFVYSAYPEATVIADATVSATGIQKEFIDVPTNNVYVGGVFVIQDNTSAHAVTEITLTETGTIDAQNDLKNIKLYYDQDTTAPYDCISETYADGATLFGSVDTDGFSSANGVSSFSDSVGIATSSTLCVYTVVDVGTTTQNGQTLNIQITVPSVDIVLSTGEASPATTVDITGSTTLRDDVLTQIHYHWRADDGSEATSTSLTSGIEDTPITQVPKDDISRLRLEVSNEGATTSTSTAFRLEFAEKVTTCSAVSSWTDVSAVGGAFDMTDSPNLIDGNDTTNIATSTGGVTDENTNFLTSNGGVKDISSQTASLTLTETQFVELEFGVSATDLANYSTTYCFRASNAGTSLPSYTVYPELTVRDNQDFNVIRGVSTLSSDSLTLTNGVDYTLKSASSTAFIRITNTQHIAAGNNTGGGDQTADNTTVYIANPGNIGTSVTFVRFGTSGNTRVAWEIVEYIGPRGGDNEMLVRGQSTTTYVTADLFATSTSVTGVVDQNDVVVFITAQANPDTGMLEYNDGLSISNWSQTASSSVFERGEGGSDSVVSWAVVEFKGRNWKVQRVPHTYSAAGSAETEAITAVNALSHAFLHTQKLAGDGENGNDEFGHEVWLSATNQISFALESGASTPASHTSIAWVIENTQTNGVPMEVTRSNGTRPNSGAQPESHSASIGKTLSNLSIASIFTNNRSTGTGTNAPDPMLAVRIISATQYEIWRSDTGEAQAYRTEVVEWPTAVRTITQNYYRFYVDNDALDPTDPWPVGATNLGENTSITAVDIPLQLGALLRIRMSLNVSGATLPANTKAYKLQYGLRSTTCSALTSEWVDLGGIGSTTAAWRGFNGTSTSDGANLSGNPPTAGALNLSVSDRAGTYEESNNTPQNPYLVSAGEDIEYDWLIQRNAGVDGSVYCFRMVEQDNTPVDSYAYYPTVLTAGFEVQSQNWRWFDDAENETPTTALELENVTPNEIDFENAIKLRTTIKETGGAGGTNQKFKLQFSTMSDFSLDVHDVMEISDCTATSTWCYFDGAGVDNATIASSTLSDANACTAGVGSGCGTHNESGTSTSSFTHQALAGVEYEFTIVHAGAQENTTYYFRAYDLNNDVPVETGSGETHPSLATAGASISMTTISLPAGTTTEGIVTDIATLPALVDFGQIPVGSEVKAAHRLSITTNAPNGYQVFMYSRQALLGPSGAQIEPITSTNESPEGWSNACSVLAKSCFGYHAGDDTLEGGSGRFSADNTYARFATSTPEEVAFSPFPVNNAITDIVYRIQVTENQEAGLYESGVVYVVVPKF